MNIAKISAAFAAIAGTALIATPSHAAEFYIGEPVVQNDLQIVPNYLVGIEMDRMPPGMETGAGTIHLEADVHATKTEKHGFAEDAWIPYLDHPLHADQGRRQIQKDRHAGADDGRRRTALRQ